METLLATILVSIGFRNLEITGGFYLIQEIEFEKKCETYFLDSEGPDRVVSVSKMAQYNNAYSFTVKDKVIFGIPSGWNLCNLILNTAR